MPWSNKPIETGNRCGVNETRRSKNILSQRMAFLRQITKKHCRRFNWVCVNPFFGRQLTLAHLVTDNATWTRAFFRFDRLLSNSTWARDIPPTFYVKLKYPFLQGTLRSQQCHWRASDTSSSPRYVGAYVFTMVTPRPSPIVWSTLDPRHPSYLAMTILIRDSSHLVA